MVSGYYLENAKTTGLVDTLTFIITKLRCYICYAQVFIVGPHSRFSDMQQDVCGIKNLRIWIIIILPVHRAWWSYKFGRSCFLGVESWTTTRGWYRWHYRVVRDRRSAFTHFQNISRKHTFYTKIPYMNTETTAKFLTKNNKFWRIVTDVANKFAKNLSQRGHVQNHVYMFLNYNTQL